MMKDNDVLPKTRFITAEKIKMANRSNNSKLKILSFVSKFLWTVDVCMVYPKIALSHPMIWGARNPIMHPMMITLILAFAVSFPDAARIPA